MVRYGVRARSVVVYETEIVGGVREDLSDLSEIVETLRDRARAAVLVTV